MNISLRSLPVVLIALIYFIALPAKATPITVINPGFENNILGDGQLLFSVNFGGIDGWVDGNSTGLYNPVGHAGFLEPIPEGNNVAFSNRDNISQVVNHALLANMIYTLTVDVGEWFGNAFAQDAEIQLWNATTTIKLGGLNVSTPIGEWTTHSLVLETDANTLGLGDDIQIILSHNNDNNTNPGSFSQVWWDNVRLDVSPAFSVPEPTTLMLMGLGLAGLFFSRKEN